MRTDNSELQSPEAHIVLQGIHPFMVQNNVLQRLRGRLIRQKVRDGVSRFVCWWVGSKIFTIICDVVTVAKNPHMLIWTWCRRLCHLDCMVHENQSTIHPWVY